MVVLFNAISVDFVDRNQIFILTSSKEYCYFFGRVFSAQDICINNLLFRFFVPSKRIQQIDTVQIVESEVSYRTDMIFDPKS